MKHYRRKKSRSSLKIAGLVGFLLVCAGGLAATALHYHGKAMPDAYGCYKGVRGTESIVMLDASEPRFNAEQRRSLLTWFEELYDGLNFGDRLQIFTTEGDQVASVIAPRLTLCGAAQSSQELESIGALPAEDGYLRRERERRLETVFRPAVEAMLALEPAAERLQAAQSPVAEMLQAISRRPEVRAGSRLYVLSDLIQSSDLARFCTVKNAMPRFARFKQRPAYARVRPDDLAGVEVTLLMLQRQGYGTAALPYCRDEDEIYAFWQDYFIDAGAVPPTRIRIRNGLL